MLYLFDPIDTLAADGLKEFQGKKLVNVAMADLKLDASPESKKSEEAAAGALKPLIDTFRQQAPDALPSSTTWNATVSFRKAQRSIPTLGIHTGFPRRAGCARS